ncbi:MAG TPA: SMP-30/gluconolactonase/LRE family protein [Crenalkalicoccus sp.]|jgi:gluconolactonase|nr:SMP-30/gluconolactonase/LRE family protein [Crenalkalicoccus sp.]
MPVTRRAALGAAAAVLVAPPVRAAWEISERYPDPRIELLDPSFARYRLFNAAVERLFTGARWSEGPVWSGADRSVIWSDIPNNRMLRWDEASGGVAEYRNPSNNSNGNTRDRQGRLVTCEHGGRRVTRTEPDGSITVIADRFEGKPLNSPNDVVVTSDGSIWFTDPPFGILGEYEGNRATSELPTNLYRVDGRTGQITVATGAVNRPNGLAFSPDERTLYVVEGGVMPRVIRAFQLTEGGTALGTGRVLYQCRPEETPDGLRVDTEGNLWCGWGMGEGLDGVRVLTPEGKPIGHIHLPERAANLCFGGAKRNRLFMAASKSLYAVHVGAQGAPGG